MLAQSCQVLKAESFKICYGDKIQTANLGPINFVFLIS